MKQLTEFLNKYKITIGFVAGALVISSQYATCTIKPNIGGEDASIQVQEDAEETGEKKSKEAN